MPAEPRQPEHADREYPIPRADPRFTVRRVLSGYAYPVNGNVHNPTPRYSWVLLWEHERIVMTGQYKGEMMHEARAYGHEIIEELESS